MAKLKKSEKILVAAAGAMVLFLVINQFVCSKKKEPDRKVVSKPAETTQAPAIAEPPKEAPKPAREKSIKPQRQPAVEYDTWGRDPFYEAYRLVSLSASDSSDFRLNGIIKKGNEAYVLIGDAILKKGERQGDLSILDIKKDRVVCRKGRRVVTLVLRDEEK